MAKLFANSEDPDQTPRSAASHLGLHCLPATLLGVYNGLNVRKLAYFLACAPNEDSNQPAHPHKEMLHHWRTKVRTVKIPIRRNLRFAHMSEGMFSDDVAQL